MLTIDSQTTASCVASWTSRAKLHAELITPFADAFLNRRSLGQTHPVYDFLFTYYSFSPSKLKKWVPSFEEELVITPQSLNEYPWLNEPWFFKNENVLSVDKKRFHENARGLANFISNLCRNVLKQAPRFGCFGLHEWAMVYKLSPEALRYTSHQLRLPPKELNSFVESQRLCCTHYDAYRFFTEEASPLNTLKPVIETRLHMEQGGCVHANMDLYKWATKLWPWIGSDFIAKTFFLALKGRELDMRASPYDLNSEGFIPIYIETEEGRKQYQKEQQSLAEESTSLRIELQAISQRLALLE